MAIENRHAGAFKHALIDLLCFKKPEIRIGQRQRDPLDNRPQALYFHRYSNPMQAKHIVAPLFCISRASLAASPIRRRTNTKKNTHTVFFAIKLLTRLDPAHDFVAPRAARKPFLAAGGANKKSAVSVPVHRHGTSRTEGNSLRPAPRTNTIDVMVDHLHHKIAFNDGARLQYFKFSDRIAGIDRKENGKQGSENKQPLTIALADVFGFFEDHKTLTAGLTAFVCKGAVTAITVCKAPPQTGQTVGTEACPGFSPVR